MSDKQLKVLCRFLIWLSIALLITFIGISNIFALETKTLYASNSSGTLSNSNKYTYGFINSGGVQTTSSASVNTTVNGRALALIYYIYEPVVLNKTYTMEINFMSNDLINTFTSSMVEVATCNAEVCNDNAIVSVTKSSPSGMSNKLTIEFNPITSGSILMVNLSDKTREFYITGLYNQQTFGIKSVTLDSTNQSQDIIDNQTNNTNNIINNNNSNTQDIINSQESNASIIIENQNENLDKLISAQYNCKIRSINLDNYIAVESARLNPDNTLTSNDNYNVSDYIRIQPRSPYSITLNYTSGNPAWCMYDKDLNVISCQRYNSQTVIDFTSASNAMYLRFSVHKSSTNVLTLGGNICLKSTDENTNAINDLNDSINSTDFDVSGLDNAVGWLPAGPVDSILNLPLNLFNAYTTALGLTCTPLNIPLPYVNKNLPIPCLRSIFQEIGIYNWWEGFGYLAAAIILYNYLLNLYTWVDKTLTLRENTMPGYYDDNFGGGA